MKRSKAIEARQHQAIEQKSGLLKNIETAENLKLTTLIYHAETLVTLSDVSVCYDENIVTYRIDKMEGVRVEETERQPHPEYETFNTEEYRRQVFSMFGGELQNVTLTVAPEMISDIYDKFGDSVRIIKKNDDTYCAEIKVQVSRPFFAWIIGSQGKVRIKTPCKVVEEFNEFIAKVKEAY